jgi:hypothetical protein
MLPETGNHFGQLLILGSYSRIHNSFLLFIFAIRSCCSYYAVKKGFPNISFLLLTLCTKKTLCPAHHLAYGSGGLGSLVGCNYSCTTTETQMD